MNYWLLILVPLTAASIGWITTQLLIKLLFYPRQSKKIFGASYQGIFPHRKAEIAEKLGQYASTVFLNLDTIGQKINDPENLKKIMPMIENHIDDFLRNRLGKEMPMISMFIGDKTISKLKEAFMKEIETLFPVVMAQYAANMKDSIDFRQIVIEKVMHLSTDKLEKKFYQLTSRDLKFAGIGGAIIGLLIGFIQVLIIYLLG